jgi:hypothetical protein
MIDNLDGNGPLRIVYIWKMVVLFSQAFDFLQHFLVVEFVIVAALEVEHPASDFFVHAVAEQKLIEFV